MVDYNKQKREAFELIEAFVRSGKYDQEFISFQVMKQTGFSKRFVVTYIEDCLSHKYFRRSDKGVLSCHS